MTIQAYNLTLTKTDLDPILEHRLSALAAAHTNVVSPEMFGAFASGVADPALDGVAILACFNALAALGGGTIEMYHAYLNHSTITLSGDQYANIAMKKMVPGAGMYRQVDNTAPDGTKHLAFIGATPNSLKNLFFEGVTFSGNGVNDYTQLVAISNASKVTFNNIRLLNNACEGIISPNFTGVSDLWVTNSYASNVGMGAQKLSAFNLIGMNILLGFSTAYNCGQGIEHDGQHGRIVGNHFEKNVFAGCLLLSTWATEVDQFGTQITSSDLVVSSNTFVDQAVGVSTGDSTGHLLSDGVTFVPGNAGNLTITGNNYTRVAQCFTGGADNFGQITFARNECENSFSSSTPAVSFQKGFLVCEANTFRGPAVGAVVAWSNIIRAGDSDPAHSAGLVRNNVIVGRMFTGAAFVFGPNITYGGNTFERMGTGAAYVAYDFAGSSYTNDGPLSRWIFPTDAWLLQSDRTMYMSPTEPSNMCVIGTPPTKGTYKAGDRLRNTAGSGVWDWRCTLGGTADTILSGVTMTTTNGSTVVTVVGGRSKIAQWQWITIAGVTGRYQLKTYDPLTGAGTVDVAAVGGVVAQAVAYSAPTWESR